MGMFYHLTQDHHVSEDLSQDVFVDVYRHLHSFDPNWAEFSTWIYRIARNKALNALKRKRPLFFAEAPETASESDVRSEVDGYELQHAFDRALAKLPAGQRLAFIWAEIEQIPYAKIAAIEQTSVGAVKSRVNRARRHVQAALQRHRIST